MVKEYFGFDQFKIKEWMQRSAEHGFPKLKCDLQNVYTFATSERPSSRFANTNQPRLSNESLDDVCAFYIQVVCQTALNIDGLKQSAFHLKYYILKE